VDANIPATAEAFSIDRHSYLDYTAYEATTIPLKHEFCWHTTSGFDSALSRGLKPDV